MRFLIAFARFWYDFIVGDDWRVAAGVTLVLLAGGALVALGATSSMLTIGLFVAVVSVFAAPIVFAARR